MRTHACVVLFLGVLGGSALAQENQQERLRRQIVNRFMMNYRTQAALTDEQYERFRAVAAESFQRRSAILRRERAFWQALEAQMRPGVAADEDSLSLLLDSIAATQGELRALFERDRREYAEFLRPVQQAQLMLTMRRFLNNIEEIVRRRMEQLPRPE